MKKYFSIKAVLLITLLLQLIKVQPLFSQTFKVIVARFEDRTGYLSRTEGQVQDNVTAGVVAGQNSAAGTVYGQASGSRTESGKGDLGSQAADIFTADLVKTGKVTILDGYSFQRTIDKNPDTSLIATAKSMGAHFLLTDNITEAGISEKGGSVLGFGGKQVQGRVHLNINLTNTSTGEVVLAEESEGNQSEGGVTLFGSDVNGKKDLGLLISAALRNAVDNCIAKIDSSMGDLRNYPIECDAAMNEGKIFLSKGRDDGVMLGDKFNIIGMGKIIKIGNKIIQEKSDKGIVTIDEVFKDYSTALPNGITVNDGDKAVKDVKK